MDTNLSLNQDIYQQDFSYIVRKETCQNGSKTIYGKLYQPQMTGKMPLLIYSHGLADDHSDGEEYAKYFSSMGIAVYTFDFCGGSSGSKSDGKTTEMSVMTEVSDLNAVLETVRTWEFVDKDKIILLGCSQGGIVSAIEAARASEKVAGLILQYPAFIIRDDARNTFGRKSNIPSNYNLMGWINVGRNYAEDVWDYDVYKEIPDYKKDVLLLHGDRDDIVPLSYSERAEEIYDKAELHVINGAGHVFYGSEDDQAKILMKEYLERLLGI